MTATKITKTVFSGCPERTGLEFLDQEGFAGTLVSPGGG